MQASLDINREARQQTGFTLLELMLAMVILAMIMTLFGSMFSSTSKAWQSGEDNAQRRRNVRALADFIGSELQGALLPVHDSTAGARANLQFVINPALSKLSSAYRHADAIFWQAPLARETSFGEIAEVGYFVKWDGGLPMLCRFFVNPSTKVGGVLKPNPQFLIYNDAAPDAWLSTEVVESVVQPASEAAGFKGLFAENVIGLWIRSFGLDGQELPREFDSRTGYDCKLPSAAGPVTEKRRLPATVQVSLAQIDSRDAFRLKPVATEVQALAQSVSTRDATQFLASLQTASTGRTDLSALLPGVRIYTTQIKLLNAR
ncbi:MAG: type II secretion system protein J [Verrucomicrobium sp.]